MPFKKGVVHKNHYCIDWLNIETQAGETINEMYNRLKSGSKVGKFLAPYVGLVQGISGDCVRAELTRRGVKLRGRGGNNNPTGRKYIYKERPKSILEARIGV